ncbi:MULTISPECIES: sigma-E factor negative regulatory protein [Shewanella]|uniref:Anti-sigma-E factor RseA n=1 Tax=Shewanella indica TaxID=768528 RepID=A0ABU4QDW6_9GAMM|nr:MULTISPECIES: RseA family anti-sigma factor [Shewanella]OIN07079.1 anti-sigma factor [Shewanella algae]MCE9793097.1 anti-sigma factor [Shewanella indica]MCL1161763.1 anti-sigma factor [Shewanella chilikensis]MDX6017058.1 RseA family anti-sigma factor [Shewanella indica]NDO76347.1 anti-sigma factor [Shewanella sp. SE1]
MDKLGQEWVSAAVDGETDAQTLAELAGDTASHDKWRNYHLIGDAMRGELPSAIPLDLSASIAAAIDKEPAIVAPVTSTQVPEDVEPQRQLASGGRVIPMFKQFGQYAIAATVAMVAIVGVQNYNQTPESQDPASPVLITRPLVGSASPVSLQTGPVQQPQGYTNEQLIEQRRRINSYIQDHMLQQRLNAGVVMDNNSEVVPVPMNR